MGRDLTKGPEWRQLLGFAFPMMGAQLLQVTYSMVDAIVVGNFVSATALGAVSVPGPIIWVVSSIASGMGTGTNIIAAQYVGASKEDEVRSAAATSVLFCGLLGIVLSVLCALLSGPIVRSFLQTPTEMEWEATVYLAVYSIGFFFQLLYQVFYGITRAFGDSKASLLFLLVAAILNLVLDLGFIILLDWGVVGAALASVIAQAGSAVPTYPPPSGSSGWTASSSLSSPGSVCLLRFRWWSSPPASSCCSAWSTPLAPPALKDLPLWGKPRS